MNNRVFLLKTLFEETQNKLRSREKIRSAYSEVEIRNITYLLIEYVAGASRTDIIVNKQVSINTKKLIQLEDAITRLINYEPIQYVIESAWFYGRQFLVNKEVLIPRRETEELVQLVVSENRDKRVKILDIGTGSGCIAITLKKEIEKSEVFAVDISSTALGVAKQNAEWLQTPVNFCEADICANNFFEKSMQKKLYHFDIIVSNPPYVRHAEVSEMSKNVVDHEPKQALFVSDKDPLVFYKAIVTAIAESSSSEMYLLKKGGGIFFEVNENLSEDVAFLLKENSFGNIKVLKDLQQKNRFVSGKLK